MRSFLKHSIVFTLFLLSLFAGSCWASDTETNSETEVVNAGVIVSPRLASRIHLPDLSHLALDRGQLLLIPLKGIDP